MTILSRARRFVQLVACIPAAIAIGGLERHDRTIAALTARALILERRLKAVAP